MRNQDRSKTYVIAHADGIKDCIWEPWGHADICAHHNWHISIPVSSFIDPGFSETCPTLPVERYHPLTTDGFTYNPLGGVFAGRAEWTIISETVRYLRMYGTVRLLTTSTIDPNLGIFLNHRPIIKVGVIFSVTPAPPGYVEGNVQITANTGYAQNFSVTAPTIREEELTFDTGVPSGPDVPLTSLNFAVSTADLTIKYIKFTNRPAQE